MATAGILPVDLTPTGDSHATVQPIGYRRSSRATIRPLSQQLNSGGGKNACYGCYWIIPENTRAVVFIHANYVTTASLTIRGAYAPSSSLGDGVSPTDANGQANPEGLFKPMTWAGAAAKAIPPAPAARVPSLVFSDPLPVSVLPRTDRGPGAVLFVRDFSDGIHCAEGYDGTTQAHKNGPLYGFGGGWLNINAGMEPPAWVSPGHYDGATGAGFQPYGHILPHAIQAITDGYVASILQTGDSVNSGVSATDGILNPGLSAALQITAQSGIPAFCINEAFSGDISENYIPRAALMLAARPSVALIQCYSRNDQSKYGDTAEAAMAGYSRSIVFAAQCLDAGVIPILQTATPFACRSGWESYETNRVAVNALVRGCGFHYVDYDGILGNNSEPNGYQRLLTVDDVHPSTIGIMLLGQAAATEIRSVLGF